MSVAIQVALNKLNQAINTLDRAVDLREQAFRGTQKDLFAAQAALNDNTGFVKDGIDPHIFLQTLDSAIEKTEKLLREGA